MTSKTKKYLTHINIFLAVLIFIDCILPGDLMPVQELDSFYTISVKTGGLNRPTFENRNIVSLLNGETFRIGKLPDGDYEKGEKIHIIKCAISKNVKSIIILNEKIETKFVSIMSVPSILGIFILASISSFLNLFYDSQHLRLLLVASMMFMFIFTGIYFFWY